MYFARKILWWRDVDKCIPGGVWFSLSLLCFLMPTAILFVEISCLQNFGVFGFVITLNALAFILPEHILNLANSLAKILSDIAEWAEKEGK